MSLNTFVKVSQVNNLSDARYCAGMGVDLMGFDIDPESTNYIDAGRFAEIAEWISGVEFVGEFKTDNAEIIQETASKYPIHFIQFEHPELADTLKTTNLGLILKIDSPLVENISELSSIINFAADKADYILIDGLSEFNNFEIKDFISEMSSKANILIGGDLEKGNIHEVITNLAVKGINLKGGNEIKPGLKDFDELADILEQLEIVD